jgi:hypothetical protein
MTIGMAAKLVYSFYPHCFEWDPCGRRVNTEQVVAQWQRLVSSGKALDVLHWAMRTIQKPCLPMVIEMAQDRGFFFIIVASFV